MTSLSTRTLDSGLAVPFVPMSDRVWTLGDPDSPDLWFNGTDPYGVEWVITDPKGWYGSAPVELGLEDRASDGAWFGRGAYKPRVVEVSGAFRGCSRAAVEEAELRLQDALDPHVDTLLAVTEDPPKQLTVRPSAEVLCDPVARNPRVRTFSFVLTAADPFKYAAGAAGLQTVPLTLLSPDSVPGRTFPAQFPRDFGGASADVGGRRVVTNAGRLPVAPVLTIQGPVEVPTLTNATTGQDFTLDVQLYAGDVAVVDMGQRTVRINGVSRFSSRGARSAFWQLTRGDNDLRFTSPTYSATARALVSFRPRWK